MTALRWLALAVLTLLASWVLCAAVLTVMAIFGWLAEGAGL